MHRLDLDDLPPKIAAQLAGVAEGEELLLVQGGAVVGRLLGGTPAPIAEPEPPADPEAHVKQVFDDFRSAIEEEF